MSSIKNKDLLFGFTLTAFGFLCLGCSDGPVKEPVIPVEGVVLYRGKPAVGAKLQLLPVEPRSDGLSPRGNVGPDGIFRLTTYDPDDGAPPGEYAVAVRWFKPSVPRAQDDDGPSPMRREPRDLLDNRYSDPRKSGIKITIEPGVVELPAIDLK